MSKFFNPDKCSFLAGELREAYEAAGAWPANAVEVTDEIYLKFRAKPPEGKTLGAVKGYPAWVDAPPPLPPTQDEINAESRAYLSLTDWYVVRFMETGEPIPSDVSEKRAAARLAVVK